ncbi:MAG: hypothetical protein ACI308_09530 [Muribaculaceae bacterium]
MKRVGIKYMVIVAMILIGGSAAYACPVQDDVPSQSVVVDGDYSTEAIERRLSEMPLQAIEGLWYYSQEHTTLLIERQDGSLGSHDAAYRITYVDSRNYQLVPGTVVGYAEQTAQSNVFNMWLYSRLQGSGLNSPIKVVATIDGGGELIKFEKPRVKFKMRFNLTHFLPTLFRGLSMIGEVKDGNQTPLGFKRLFPSQGGDDTLNGVIRYL